MADFEAYWETPQSLDTIYRLACGLFTALEEARLRGTYPGEITNGEHLMVSESGVTIGGDFVPIASKADVQVVMRDAAFMIWEVVTVGEAYYGDGDDRILQDDPHYVKLFSKDVRRKQCPKLHRILKRVFQCKYATPGLVLVKLAKL